MVAIDEVIIDNIIESMPSGVLVINGKGEVLVANAALESILGFSEQELTSHGWGELFFADESNLEFNQIILDVIQRELVNMERKAPYLNPKTGEGLYLSITSSFLREEDKTRGVVLLIKDETNEVLSQMREKRLLKQTSKVERERVEGLKTLAKSVAHQVRNPIMTIGGFANFLLRNPEVPGSAHEHLNIMLDEAGKLEELVKAVGKYASLPPVKRTRVVATALLESVRSDTAETAEQMGVDFSCELDCSNLQVEVDPGLFKHALQEIFQNALDFCRGNKAVVEAGVEQVDGDARFTVTDHGLGIDQAELPYVFDPFFTTKPSGVGMGLCDVKQIVQEHRGDIAIESEKGGWTRVTINVPLHQVAEEPVSPGT